MQRFFQTAIRSMLLVTARGESDKLAGRVARLLVHGRSNAEIVFLRPGEPAE